MKKLLLAGFLSVGLLTACGTATQGPLTTSGEVIKLGFVGPLTGDGASYGELTKNTVQDFLEANPVWGGKKVELIAEDGKCNGQDAASAATKLVDVDHVDFIFSGGCSGEGLAIVPIAEKAKVLVFSPINTSPELTGISKYYLRDAPSDSLGGKVMAETVLADGNKKVALIIENTDFATAYADVFKKEYTGEIVVEESYNPGNHEFKTVLQKVKTSGATAIVHMNQTPVSAGFLAKQKAELGIKFVTYSTDATAGVDFTEIGKDAAEGQIIVLTQADKSKAAVVESIEKYKKAHGSLELEAYHILSIDLLSVIKNAVEATKGTDALALRTWLEAMPPYQGLGGPLSFDENGDSNTRPAVLIFRDGAFVAR